MMPVRLILLILLLIPLLTACESRKSTPQPARVEVPRPFETGDAKPRATARAVAQSRPGGPATAVDFPVYAVPVDPPSVPAAEAALRGDELVLGLVLNGQAMAYPVRFLMLFGVVNDRVGGLAVAPTWSSLCGSGVIYARSLGGSENRFDFGAALVKNNLLIVDRETGSVWSQLPGEAIAGPMMGTHLKIVPSLQTTWRYWSRVRPDTRVTAMADEEGHPYFYQEFDLSDGYSFSGERAHDTRGVGLGIVVGGQAHFFPLEALARHVVPVIVGEGADRNTIVYKDAGLTAWAEDSRGLTVGSALCYQRAWLEFHPGSEVFSAGK